MPLVSPAQLAAIRTVANNGLESRAHILRSTQTETNFGSVDAWATVALDQPCWLRNMTTTSVTEIVLALATLGTFRCHFAAGTDVQPGDRLIFPDLDEKPFDVSDTNAENTLQVFTTAIVRRTE